MGDTPLPESGSDREDHGDAELVRRAQQTIAVVYGLIAARRGEGTAATGVVLSPRMAEELEGYRARIGELPGGGDYLGRHELFGLPILIDTDGDLPRLMPRG